MCLFAFLVTELDWYSQPDERGTDEFFGVSITRVTSLFWRRGRYRDWIFLDKDDDDFNVILNCFLAAIQTMFPAAGQETLDLLGAPNLPRLPVLSRSLISELDQIEAASVLVLDDYHTIPSAQSEHFR